MNYGQGAISFVNNSNPGGGGAITGARNGLSVTGGSFVEHGGFLIHDTLEDLSDFQFVMQGTDPATFESFGFLINPVTFASGTQGLMLLGSVNEFDAASFIPQIKIDSIGQEISMGLPDIGAFSRRRFFTLETAAGTVEQGDIDGTLTSFLSATDYFDRVFFVEDSGNSYLEINKGGNLYRMGDIDNTLNGTFLQIDDNAQIFSVLNHFSNVQLSLDSVSGLYAIGDINSAANGQRFSVDDISKLYTMGTPGAQYLSLSGTNNLYSFGDLNATNNGTSILLDDTVQSFTFSTNTFSYTFDSSGIKTAGGSAVPWQLLNTTSAAAVLDASQYLNVVVGGVALKIALIV